MITIMTGWQNPALATCNVTSDGTGTVGRITKFTPSSCNIENSVLSESSGKIGIGTTAPTATLDVNGAGIIRGVTGIGASASGGFEFQVTAPNQGGMLVEGPAAGVGAGLDLKTTGTGGLQWEILDTEAAAAQGPDKLNFRNVKTGFDILTITDFGNVGIADTAPNASLSVVNGINGNSLVLVASFSGSGGGCTIDNLGDLTCTGNIKGNTPIAWHQRGRAQQPAPIPVRASAGGNAPVQAHRPPLMEVQGVLFEDFGSARLNKGTASIPLKSGFAEAIAGMSYQVFVTPEGDCKGLYVARKTPIGFEVRELGGGHSSLEFDYRVVSHRKLVQPITSPASDDLANDGLSSRSHSRS